MHRKREYLFIFMPLIIGTIIAEMMIYSNGGNDIMDSGCGIVAAIIAGCFLLLVLLITLKRDSPKIDKIKDDTGGIKPQIDTINKNSEETNDVLVKQIAPFFLMSGDNISLKINEIVEDVRYKKRLHDEMLHSVHDDIDNHIDFIDRLSEYTTSLENENKDLRNDLSKNRAIVEKLMNQNEKLRLKISDLNAELSNYQDYNHRSDGLEL